MKLILSVIGLALATLRENKARSFLTLLGVMIGTGTIIGVGSILTGLDGAVTGAIRSLGTNTAIVMKIGPSFGGGRTPEQRMRKPLTYENVVAITERCPSVEHVSPILNPPNGILRARYMCLATISELVLRQRTAPGTSDQQHQCATAAAAASLINRPVRNLSSENGAAIGWGSPRAIVDANIWPEPGVALKPPVPQPQFT